MANSESQLDRLWSEYGLVFRDFDDISLGRWLSQTLSQMAGKAWRLSHPLVGSYRLAAQAAHERQIWLKRVAHIPSDYQEASCCRAPLVPLLTRDVVESGLICLHCNETSVPFDEIPGELPQQLRSWAEQYAPVHTVAHWEDRQKIEVEQYDRALDTAAQEAARLLAKCGDTLAPLLVEYYPAVTWEDQDECLQVRPEEINLRT